MFDTVNRRIAFLLLAGLLFSGSYAYSACTVKRCKRVTGLKTTDKCWEHACETAVACYANSDGPGGTATACSPSATCERKQGCTCSGVCTTKRPAEASTLSCLMGITTVTRKWCKDSAEATQPSACGDCSF